MEGETQRVGRPEVHSLLLLLFTLFLSQRQRHLRSRKIRGMKTMTPIRIRTRELREGRGWSQADIARRSGVPQATISRIEAGKTDGISFDVLERLAKAFDCHPAALIEHEK